MTADGSAGERLTALPHGFGTMTSAPYSDGNCQRHAVTHLATKVVSDLRLPPEASIDPVMLN